MPRIYIIILNYKKWKDLAECLETLLRSQYENFTVFVIDNDSQNHSLEHLQHWAQNNTTFSNRLSYFSKNILSKPISHRQFAAGSFCSDINPAEFPRMVFIQHDENKGFARGINPVLECIRNEDAYVWLLNPDMVVEESTLPGLTSFALANPGKSIIGSVVKYYSDPKKIFLYAGGKINFNSATVKMIRQKKRFVK